MSLSPRRVPAHVPQMGGALQFAEYMLLRSTSQHRGLDAGPASSWPPCPPPAHERPFLHLSRHLSENRLVPLSWGRMGHTLLLSGPVSAHADPTPAALPNTAVSHVPQACPPPGASTRSDFPKCACPRLPPPHQTVPPQKASQLPSPKSPATSSRVSWVQESC